MTTTETNSGIVTPPQVQTVADAPPPRKGFDAWPSMVRWPLRILWWSGSWFPLHLALVIFGFYTFNRAIVDRDMVMSRRVQSEYSQYSMPLYVRPDPAFVDDEGWIEAARQRLHNLHRMAPPILFALFWMLMVAAQAK